MKFVFNLFLILILREINKIKETCEKVIFFLKKLTLVNFCLKNIAPSHIACHATPLRLGEKFSRSYFKKPGQTKLFKIF